jgi:hypothetical protein
MDVTDCSGVVSPSEVGHRFLLETTCGGQSPLPVASI